MSANNELSSEQKVFEKKLQEASFSLKTQIEKVELAKFELEQLANSAGYRICNKTGRIYKKI